MLLQLSILYMVGASDISRLTATWGLPRLSAKRHRNGTALPILRSFAFQACTFCNMRNYGCLKRFRLSDGPSGRTGYLMRCLMQTQKISAPVVQRGIALWRRTSFCLAGLVVAL